MYALRLGGRHPQVQQDESSNVFADDFDDNDFIIDRCHETLGAIDHLLDRPASHQDRFRWPQFVLKHHLYTVITDRCQVDHDIEQLQARNVIRLIRIDRIPPSPLIIIIKTRDLANVLHQKAPSSLITSSFIKILPKCCKTEISRAELVHCMKDGNSSITELLDQGLVVNLDDTTLRFSIPECGRLVHNLIQGRLELVMLIKRRKQSSSRLLTAVSKLKLKKSTLTSEFIVQDLLALGVLERSWSSLPKDSTDPVIVIGDESIII